MSIIQIRNFGGELPRVSAAALPSNAAQINRDLLTTSVEFRPLQADATVSACPANTKSLYRLSRDASGVLRTDESTGWVFDAKDKSFVKGQINDDATDRTYVSVNDGTSFPYAIDALGASRQLGVPAPTGLTATLAQGNYFTATQANAWADTVLPKNLADMVLACMELREPFTRVNATATNSIAGPYSFYGMYWIDEGDTNFWDLRYSVSLLSPNASGLLDPSIHAVQPGAGTPGAGTVYVPLACLPHWGFVSDPAGLLARLMSLTSPRDGTPLFPLADATDIRDYLITRFDPLGDDIKTQRTLLDATVRDFKAAVNFVLTDQGAEPVPPVKPTVPEYDYDYNNVWGN